jgi:uncharacterized Zn finger protein
MQYLKQGTFPVLRQDGKKKSPLLFWALPPVGLTDQKSWKTPGAPFFEVLIDIAIAERRPDEVIAWYDRFLEFRHGHGMYYRPDDKVADAVAEQFPDHALDIWREKAERLAEEARPKSYEASVGYLKKIRALMKNQGRDDAWEEYLATMRGVHARKKRFLEMLIVLEGEKILKS